MRADEARGLIGQRVAFIPADDVRLTSYDKRRDANDDGQAVDFGTLQAVEKTTVSRPDRARPYYRRRPDEPMPREDVNITVATVTTDDGAEHVLRPSAILASERTIRLRRERLDQRRRQRLENAATAKGLQARLEGIGTVERNGSDEFAILLDLDEAEIIASTFERYRKALELITAPGHSERARAIAQDALDPDPEPTEADGPHEGRVDRGGTDR